MFITLLVFIAVLGLLVFVHELGHFLAAKRSGVKVLEFAFGFKPRLWSKKIGETTYGINLIPLGGYIHMYGEDKKGEGSRAYNNKSPRQRLGILIAGPLMNFILGYLVLVVLMIVGFEPLFPGISSNPYIKSGQVISISSVASGSPAQNAGLKDGERILKLNNEKMVTDSDFISKVNSLKGQVINVTVADSVGERTVALTPRVNPPSGEGALGVMLSTTGKIKSSVIASPVAALYETGRIIGLSAAGFASFVKNLIVHQQVGDEVTGLIGVGEVTGIARRLGLDYLGQLVAIISIGLGVVNLLPIIPLDGGHIATVAYEGIARRRLSEKQLGVIASVGLTIIILLFIIVTTKDIIRFNVLERLRDAL
jgi:regulator of sigma E protease